LLSDDSPLIIVLNKVDVRVKTLDERSLQRKFPNIVAFHRVSALTGQGIAELRTDIQNNIVRLKHIGDTLPKVWIDVRTHLESLERDYIGYREYEAICAKHDLDPEQARFLSRYFHDLGVFLNFHEHSILRDIVFLRPEWATGAVYRVIDTKEVVLNYGKFEYGQLRHIWRNYPEDKYIHLLALMEKFELCFCLDYNQTYIVPELLPARQPDFEWNESGESRFEYQYEFMPAGIMTRLIVRTHAMIQEEHFWKDGVVLERKIVEQVKDDKGNPVKDEHGEDDIRVISQTVALMTSDRFKRTITVKLKGDDKHGLLEIIRSHMDYIHHTINNLEVEERIPCICHVCQEQARPQYYRYVDLCEARKLGHADIECHRSHMSVSIEAMLGGVVRVREHRDEVHIHGDYLEAGASKMKVSKMNITHSQVNLADRIRKIDYHESCDLARSDFELLKEEIARLSPADVERLVGYAAELANTKNEGERTSRAMRMKEFLIANGSQVARGLTVAGIVESMKMILHLWRQ
jgi:hypothetical protein